MAKGFTFKQFHINDHDCGMPVSTDGVLLGSWATLNPHGIIADIGTGSGLLALMAAQRTQTYSPSILAIDIDDKAVAAAQRNFADSPWQTQLTGLVGNIVDWCANQPAGCIDTILCNPPYFNSGEQANCQARATARHTDSLSHQHLLDSINHLLSETGVANLILPEYEGRQFITLASKISLNCLRLCEVRSTDKKLVNRLLISLSKEQRETVTEQLVIHQQGQYSAEFIALTHDFYLKM
ncbi:methyltransferase [Photobacterium makurazakiensis]|uniref:tRNA1(Val) (adenine(37)-N6)-methyltransferase n=1 Tax=Photobacterium makurazakiensis TaxID=2910234 RepID=UPI003D0EC0F0